MNLNEHQEVLEAMGMLASKSAICNKLNRVYVRTDDPEFRTLILRVISEIQTTSNNTRVQSPKNMKNGVPSSMKLVRYCESSLFTR